MQDRHEAIQILEAVQAGAVLATGPDAVADFHLAVTKNNGPVSADHFARVIRATYKRAGRRDINLPARYDGCRIQ
jgi:hypothetical protein